MKNSVILDILRKRLLGTPAPKWKHILTKSARISSENMQLPDSLQPEYVCQLAILFMDKAAFKHSYNPKAKCLEFALKMKWRWCINFLKSEWAEKINGENPLSIALKYECHYFVKLKAVQDQWKASMINDAFSSNDWRIISLAFKKLGNNYDIISKNYEKSKQYQLYYKDEEKVEEAVASAPSTDLISLIMTTNSTIITAPASVEFTAPINRVAKNTMLNAF